MTNIKGKNVLLTGASRGLGVYIARHLVKEEANIICVARSQSGIDQTCTEIHALGGKCSGLACDISNLSDLSILVNQVQESVGQIDILINNAGIEIYKHFIDYSLTEINSILITNLIAAMELSRLILPGMITRNSGHIVNIASLAGKKGVAYNSIYSASKAGLIMWTDSIRQELYGTNVKISVVCPGYVNDAGMTANTQVPAPKLAGISTPNQVAKAVINAIKQNQAEVIVNENIITEFFTKKMLALGQFYPDLVDSIYRSLGVVKLNKRRVGS
jgi:short-subunit dehydrogenase